MRIDVISLETGKSVHSVGCGRCSLRRAEKVERGMNINLDHERFFTEIVEEEGDAEGQEES